MTTLDIFLQYFGAIILALIFLYGLKNYWITAIAGFVAFCVFYFSFSTKNFDWQIDTILQLLKNAAIIYYISFVIAVIIYKIIPLKQDKEIAV